MRPLPIRALALHRVTRLPLDLGDPVYSHYTLLKLGVEESVSFYARKLVPLVEPLIASGTASAEWILTSPAWHAVPSAANLLCRSVHELLAETSPGPDQPEHIDIRQLKEPAPADFQEFQRRHNYSQLEWQDRIKSRAQTDSLMIEDRVFAGRPVIFVNDINVTGAQRLGMERYFQDVDAASVTWLCIIDVDAAIGRSEPRLEYAINHSNRLSVDQLGEILAGTRIRFTSMCLGRVLAYETSEIERILNVLDSGRRREILRLALAEGRFDGADFAEKMNLLRAACGTQAPECCAHSLGFGHPAGGGTSGRRRRSST